MTATFCPHIWGGDSRVIASKDDFIIEITENNSNHGPLNHATFFLSRTQVESLRNSLTEALESQITENFGLSVEEPKEESE